MSILYYFIDEETRKLRPEAAHKVVAQKDHNADVIRVGIPETMNSVDLETSAVRCMYQRPKETEVRSKTATYYDTSGGYLWYDWTLQEGDTAKAGKINFSVCLQHIEGGLLTVDWNTTIGEIFVKTSYHSDDSDEGDETITPTVAQRVAVLEASTQRLYSIVGGAPEVVSSTSDMTDEEKLYVLTTDGCWYYYDGSAWVAGGEYGAVATDTTLTQSGIPADAKAVGDAISGVRSRMPEIFDSDANNVDLDISDTQGNVIARFADGHIQTKEFDSSEVLEDVTLLKTGVEDINSNVEDINSNVGDLSDLSTSAKDSLVSAINEAAQSGGSSDSDIIKDSNEQGIDLDISDSQGNVVARFVDGAIKTKRFDSDDVTPAIETFSVSKTFVRGSANVLTISGTFRKGDEIYYHLADGNRYDAYGRYATYYEGNKIIFNNRRGSNGYVRHIISADCSSVGISIGGAEYTDGTELTLYVYRKNGDVTPKIVTIKADGTGMFQTLKAAVDSITDANHLTNPYVIEIYEGTYNTLDGYTEEEIQSADEGGGYGQDTMVGVKLTDGMSLVGIGRADNIILECELDSANYNSNVRGNISTLNLEGEGRLENMTIIGKNIRYCVHDDFLSPVNSHDKRILRNLKFKGEYLSYYPFFTTYGAGMSAPRDYLIENCDFGYDLGIHSNGGYTFGCTIEVNNCSGARFRIGDSATAESDAINRVIINNCNFQMLKINHGTSGLSNHMMVEGTGNEFSMVSDATLSMHRLGMIDLVPKGISTGKLVKRVSSGLTVEATNNKTVALGVVIGSDDYFSYVQKRGLIPCNYIGLTGLAIGDYLTVDSSGAVITGGTESNAIAIVKAVDENNVAYAQLLI